MATRIDLPAPPAVSTRGGGGSHWVELTRAPNDIEAHLLQGRLHEAGVESRALKDRSAPGAWLYGGSNPWAPVTILVRALQLEDARIVLAEVSFDAPDAPEPLAPAQRGSRWRLPLVWWLTAIALGLLVSAVTLLNTANALRRGCDLPIVCAQPSGAGH